ncbi:MAG: hypothetical protein ACRCXT_15445 [Paraclostridium sp.]
MLGIIFGILTFILLYTLIRNLSLKKQLEISMGYRKFSEESVLMYKNMLYDKALDSNDIELYSKVQELSETRRKEFLEYVNSVEKLFKEGKI